MHEHRFTHTGGYGIRPYIRIGIYLQNTSRAVNRNLFDKYLLNNNKKVLTINLSCAIMQAYNHAGMRQGGKKTGNKRKSFRSRV